MQISRRRENPVVTEFNISYNEYSFIVESARRFPEIAVQAMFVCWYGGNSVFVLGLGHRTGVGVGVDLLHIVFNGKGGEGKGDEPLVGTGKS